MIPGRSYEFGQDLRRQHGVQVTIRDFDVLLTDSHAAFLDELPILPDIVVCLVGLLGDQTLAERNLAEADLILRSNPCGNIRRIKGFHPTIGIRHLCTEIIVDDIGLLCIRIHHKKIVTDRNPCNPCNPWLYSTPQEGPCFAI